MRAPCRELIENVPISPAIMVVSFTEEVGGLEGSMKLSRMLEAAMATLYPHYRRKISGHVTTSRVHLFNELWLYLIDSEETDCINDEDK